MSLYFNWDRLDQTAAEALRLLINEKLTALVREMRGASPGSVATSTTPHAATSALPTPNRSTNCYSSHTRTAVTTGGGGNVSSLCSSPVPVSGSAQPALRFAPTVSPATATPVMSGATEGKKSSSSGGIGGNAVTSADAPHSSRSADPAFVIEELAVTNFEWGAVPPFVELVQFQDALPLDTAPCMTAATPHAVPSSSSASSTQFGLGEPHRPVPVGCTATTTLSGGNIGTMASGPTCAVQRERSTPQSLVMHTPPPAVLIEDRLAPLLGPGGLFVRLHITYGGTMRVTLAARVRYEIRYGPIALPVRMNVMLHATDLDFDGYLCLNLHHNACRLWLEPGEPTASPISRMSMTAVFGGGDGNGDDETDNEFVSSSMEYNSWYESLTTEEEDESVFTDDKVIARFVLDLVSDVMRRKIIAPHSVTIPLTFVE